MKKQNRIIFIDIARGIAILLMIIGHTIKYGTLRNAIFSFHMPLFVIVSGYFYKEKSIKDEICNSIVHLLIPCIIIGFFVTLKQNLSIYDLNHSIIQSLKSIAVGYTFQMKIPYHFPDIGELWFVYMLIINKLIFNINKKSLITNLL